jgi:hypothetical protein
MMKAMLVGKAANPKLSARSPCGMPLMTTANEVSRSVKKVSIIHPPDSDVAVSMPDKIPPCELFVKECIILLLTGYA